MPANEGQRTPPQIRPTVPDGFASTEWSLVLAASADGGLALDRLCRAYWRPVYIYIRASGVARDEAEDATQEFFADMLRRDWLKLVDHERGSFRAYLRNSVRFFVANRRRHANAIKRGGQDVVLSLDTAECERELAGLAGSGLDPALMYERNWTECVVQSAITRLAAEQARAGKGATFERLKPFLTTAPAPGEYERLAAETGTSAGQVAVWVHRLSRRFTELIRAEIAETLTDRREVEGELRYLLQLVARKTA